MPKIFLTNRWLDAPPKAPPKKRVDYSDTTNNLVVRVNDKGEPTFVVLARFPGSNNPTRRTLGTYDAKAAGIENELQLEGRALPRPPTAMSLARARQLAVEWTSLISLGIDPTLREIEKVKASTERAKNTFESVALAYIDFLPTRKRNRHAAQDARLVRGQLLERRDASGKIIWRNNWATKPIADVTDEDIATLIEEIRDRPAPAMAYDTLSQLKTMFSWAIFPVRKRIYGLKNNITRDLQPMHFQLSKTQRKRVFNDDEIRAYWEAADNTPYPLGPFYKALMLNAQRKNENAGAKWEEFELWRRDPIWIIPEERFKSGQEQPVPISPDFESLLSTLPKHDQLDGGTCIFSTTNGRIPINGFSKAKAALHTAMLEILRQDNPKATLPRWGFHDVRRTVRTRLSGLKINSDVAELIIGHGKVGLRRVYDQYEFEPEMREALCAWAEELRRILSKQ